ncbi:MAG: hypothetical protein K9L02_02960 [Acholeplasmataceae bacterium]|nr:hypothetical protein [Acholeplasmataceae bacterium]
MKNRTTVYLIIISLLYPMLEIEYNGFNIATFILTVIVVFSISSTLKYIFYSFIYNVHPRVLTSKAKYHRKMMRLVTLNKVDNFNLFANIKMDEQMIIEKQLIESLDESLKEVYEVLNRKSARYVYKKHILKFKESVYFDTISDKKGYIEILKTIKFFQKQKKYVEVYYYDVVSGEIFRNRKFNYLGLLSIYFTIFLAFAVNFDFAAYFTSYKVNLIIFAVYIATDLIFDGFSYQKSFNEESKIYEDRTLLVDEYLDKNNLQD